MSETDLIDLPITTREVPALLAYTRGGKTREEQATRLAEALSWYGLLANDAHPERTDVLSVIVRTLDEHAFDLSHSPELDRDADGTPTGTYTLYCKCKHPFRPSSEPNVNEHRDHLAQMILAALTYNGADTEAALTAAQTLADEARSDRVDLDEVALALFDVRDALRRPLLTRSNFETARIEAAAKVAHERLRWTLGGEQSKDWALLDEDRRDGWREYVATIIAAHSAASTDVRTVVTPNDNS